CTAPVATAVLGHVLGEGAESPSSSAGLQGSHGVWPVETRWGMCRHTFAPSSRTLRAFPKPVRRKRQVGGLGCGESAAWRATLNRTTLRLSRDRLSPNRSKGDYVHEGVESSASSAVDAGGESVGSPASHSSRPGVPYSLDENALALLGAPMTDWQPAVRRARRAGAARLVQLTHRAAERIAAGAARSARAARPAST